MPCNFVAGKMYAYKDTEGYCCTVYIGDLQAIKENCHRCATTLILPGENVVVLSVEVLESWYDLTIRVLTPRGFIGWALIRKEYTDDWSPVTE
jgi:hypothetical protein